MSRLTDMRSLQRTSLIAAIAIACLGGTARSADLALPSGGLFRVPVTSLKEARSRTTVLQQYDFSCGSAAVATLLSFHYRHPVSEQMAFQAMFERGDQAKIRQEGFSMLDMKNFLASLGYEADGFREPVTKLADTGLPAIALIQDKGYYHFVVIKGVRDGRVLLGDPALGLRAMSISEFEALWPNRILFVVLNRTEMAQANLPAEWAVKPRAQVRGLAASQPLLNELMRRQPGDLAM